MISEPVVLGIDIGGTNTAFGLVSASGECFFNDSVKTKAANSAEDLFFRLFSHLSDVVDTTEINMVGIGIGAPNGNYYTGCVENPPNLNWDVVNIVDLVKRYFDIPVLLTNDANAAALGEMKFGAASNYKNFVEITLGTGLGSGFIVNGEMLYGHDGFAGELGHVIVEPGGRLCGCGRRGCLEAYVCATGIVRTVFELLSDSMESSKLREIPYNKLNSKLIYDFALENDPIALQAFKITSDMLGKELANIVSIFSPEAIVLFGGLAEAGELLIEPTQKVLDENVLPVFLGKTKIVPSGLMSGEAAILGAASLIWHHLNPWK